MKALLVSAAFSLGIPLLILGAFLLFIEFFIKRQRARKRFSPLTEDMLRMPAERLQKEFDDLDVPLMFGCLLIILPAMSVGLTARTNIVAWGLVALIVLYGAGKVWRVLDKVITLRLAIDGERYTGQELNFLMQSGAWVYHDIPYQYGNIDHVVISTGGVFAVETKAYRKPKGDGESSRLGQVVYDGTELAFPHMRTSEPIEQARRHAKYLQQAIQKDLGILTSVTPAIALPGWFVERTARSDVWVFNPKRGAALASQVQKKQISVSDTERIANYIEGISRTVRAGSKKMDPDAANYYDKSGQRKHEVKRLGS